MRRKLDYNHGGATKKGSLHKTIIIPVGSELYPYCFNEEGEKLAEAEVRVRLTAAPEHIKQIAISKGFVFLEQLEKVKV